MSMTHLDPRTKILMLMFFGVLVVMLDSATSLLFCFLISIGMIVLSFPSWRQYRLLIVFIVLATWGLIYSQAIFYNAFPRTVLFTLVGHDVPIIGGMTGGVRVYREGLLHGAIQSLRFNTTLTIGCFIVWSTQPRDLLLAFVKLRVPYSLAFMVNTSLHYIPLIAAESANVIRIPAIKRISLLSIQPAADHSGDAQQFSSDLDQQYSSCHTSRGSCRKSRVLARYSRKTAYVFEISEDATPRHTPDSSWHRGSRCCHHAKDDVFLLRKWN